MCFHQHFYLRIFYSKNTLFQSKPSMTLEIISAFAFRTILTSPKAWRSTVIRDSLFSTTDFGISFFKLDVSLNHFTNWFLRCSEKLLHLTEFSHRKICRIWLFLTHENGINYLADHVLRTHSLIYFFWSLFVEILKILKIGF